MLTVYSIGKSFHTSEQGLHEMHSGNLSSAWITKRVWFGPIILHLSINYNKLDDVNDLYQIEWRNVVPQYRYLWLRIYFYSHEWELGWLVPIGTGIQPKLRRITLPVYLLHTSLFKNNGLLIAFV